MLFTPFTFRNNVTAKNRFFKSAMEEDLSHHSKVSGELIKLYDTWAKGGTGILVTGNVMVSKSGKGKQPNLSISPWQVLATAIWQNGKAGLCTGRK